VISSRKSLNAEHSEFSYQLALMCESCQMPRQEAFPILRRCESALDVPVAAAPASHLFELNENVHTCTCIVHEMFMTRDRTQLMG